MNLKIISKLKCCHQAVTRKQAELYIYAVSSSLRWREDNIIGQRDVTRQLTIFFSQAWYAFTQPDSLAYAPLYNWA